MKRNRVFALLLVLMFVFALTPAREVKAEGEGCPECGEVGELIRATDSHHIYKCTNNQCKVLEYSKHHSGGTATCTEKEKCAICGHEYGSPDPDAHDWGDWEPLNETHHQRKCKRNGCSAKETGKHSGGIATCTEKAKCETCGQEYGGTNPDNHDLIDHAAKAPTCTDIGWDAYQTCSQCDYTTYAEKAALGNAGSPTRPWPPPVPPPASPRASTAPVARRR